MVEKFRNKYRVPSGRLQNWDYGYNGAYFITICTKEMKHFYGDVVDKKMILNFVGLFRRILDRNRKKISICRIGKFSDYAQSHPRNFDY